MAAVKYVGRFAPSPTGKLHFGSLIAAAASYLQAKHQRGLWLVRVEDIDPPREVAGSSEQILNELERLGMRPDGPVLYQSLRSQAYDQAIRSLLDQGRAYWCGCSRKDLPASRIYPGTCRNGLGRGRVPRSIRLRVGHVPIRFTDLIQGQIETNLQNSAGDFVIRRADALPAYQLAVVVDDAYQRVSEVVRGADLLDSTARQIFLQQCLGLPHPRYAHHPLAIDDSGCKLSKRLGSDPLLDLRPVKAIRLALEFLGQQPPRGMGLKELWAWAIRNWRIERITQVREQKI